MGERRVERVDMFVYRAKGMRILLRDDLLYLIVFHIFEFIGYASREVGSENVIAHVERHFR